VSQFIDDIMNRLTAKLESLDIVVAIIRESRVTLHR